MQHYDRSDSARKKNLEKTKTQMGKELLRKTETENREKNRPRIEPTGKMMTSCLLTEYEEFLAISFGHSDTIRTLSKRIQSISQIIDIFEITMGHACSPFASKFRQLKKVLIID